MPATPLHQLFDIQYRASRGHADVSLDWRLERLTRLQAMLAVHGAALAQAVQADFGVRSSQLTEVADGLVLQATIGQLKAHCADWMKPERVPTPFYLLPAKGFIQRQPLGVVGIIGPWNYPLQLTLGPLATALAAGNRAMLKPSELTPRTSALLAELLHAQFPPDEVAVVQGGPDVAQAFADLPFDHLMFTGSTAVGRKVAQAAARNLTPTTLELGGKSPCIIDPSCAGEDMLSAALRVAHGKLLNAGQTCIAPDYVLLPEGHEQEFEQAFAKAVQQLFPPGAGQDDYAAIISDRHLARLQQLLDEASSGGARVVQLLSLSEAHPRQMAPALVFNPPTEARLMTEEIFGPLLPVVTYRRSADVVEWINARPRPLALYWFGSDTGSRDQVLRQTVSGGVTVNDTLLHIAHHGLPFGGVGESGWGAYHGEAGFLRFSHQKPVLVQSRWAAGHVLYPPYGKRFQRVMGLLKRWL